MKMKVLLVSCLIVGVAQATIPGFGGGGDSGSGGGGIFQSIFGLFSGGGGGHHGGSTDGEVVDGHGGGVSGGSSGVHSSASGSAGGSQGYDYAPANPQPSYGNSESEIKNEID